MLNRAAVIATTSMLFLPASAISSPTMRKISETQKLADVATHGKPGSAGYGKLIAGTLDGKVGATAIHGALRAVSTFPGSGRETVHGTEYDADGSRSYVIHVHITGSNGHITTTGTGTWTGGTGIYAHARGTFKTSGIVKPSGGGPLGYATIHLKGSITY
jgi:hypothetical protein